MTPNSSFVSLRQVRQSGNPGRERIETSFAREASFDLAGKSPIGLIRLPRIASCSRSKGGSHAPKNLSGQLVVLAPAVGHDSGGRANWCGNRRVRLWGGYGGGYYCGPGPYYGGYPYYGYGGYYPYYRPGLCRPGARLRAARSGLRSARLRSTRSLVLPPRTLSPQAPTYYPPARASRIHLCSAPSYSQPSTQPPAPLQ